jgi:hypothetical protein
MEGITEGRNAENANEERNKGKKKDKKKEVKGRHVQCNCVIVINIPMCTSPMRRGFFM